MEAGTALRSRKRGWAYRVAVEARVVRLLRPVVRMRSRLQALFKQIYQALLVRASAQDLTDPKAMGAWSRLRLFLSQPSARGCPSGGQRALLRSSAVFMK